MISTKLLFRQISKSFKRTIKGQEIDTTQLTNLIKKVKSMSAVHRIKSLQILKKLIISFEASRKVVIESCQELSASEKQQLEKFSSKLSKDPKFDYQINPSLLAGVRVKIGDDLYEDSISSRLNQLKGAIDK